MNTLAVGVQSKGIVYDNDPLEGFEMMKRAGFSCCDFRLDSYLTDLSFGFPEDHDFFQRSVGELKRFFAPHKEAAETAGIAIHQMYMPYPVYIPNTGDEKSRCRMQAAASKSMEICAFFQCPYMVVHGLDLAGISWEYAAVQEWISQYVETLAPMAKELKITICIENGSTNIGNHITEDYCHNVKNAVAFIDHMNIKYGAEVLGFCFDTGQANLAGINFEDFIMQLGTRLKVLHIHDNDGIRDLHQIPFTSAGDCGNVSPADWDGFVRGLQKIQFDKVLSFDIAPALTAFPGKMKQDVLRFVALIGSYFAGEIQANTNKAEK